jgi:HSP20 family protein
MNELRVRDPFAPEAFDDFFRGFMRPWRAEFSDRAPQIKVDIHEDDGGYTVKAEIPGVRKEDIDVRVDGKMLTVSAEVKKDTEEKKDGRVIRSERQFGFASRSLMLGSDVESGRAEARYDNGVLDLRLPKKVGGTNQKLKIS